MYKIPKEIAQAFKTERALARIAVELVSGEAIDEITEHDIDTLTIERAAVSGNVIEIGAARLFELKLRLNNAEEKFNDVQFDGSHLRVRTGVKKDNGVELIPMGLFIVDGHEEDNGDLILTAFDYMVKFDRAANFSGVVFPTTPATLIRRACDRCGVDPSRLDFSKLPNADYVIERAPESAVTWRSVLMWCCQILGACAYTDAEGYLIVKWYTDTGEKLTASDRFSHKLFLKDVTVKGVEIVTDEAIYRAGSDEGFIFSIEENELITHDFESVARNLGAALIGFTHRPFYTPTLPFPHLFPLDMMTYVKPNGEEVAVCVSSYKFTLNGRTELKGVGESETTSGFATLSPLTEKQKAVIAAGLRKIEKETRDEISEAEASLLRLNEVMGNAFGLYVVTHKEQDGSTQIYFCDKPTLEQSGLIYAFNAGGFAWTTEWKGSNEATIWNYGITRDGNAILNYLTLNKLTAEHISVAEIVGAINKSSGESILQIDADHLNINGAISANGTFSIDKSGFMKATGGEIAGLLIERGEFVDDNEEVKVQKTIRTPSDEFHILATEDKQGKTLSSEVAITSLLCDTVTARNNDNEIALCWSSGGKEVTATVGIEIGSISQFKIIDLQGKTHYCVSGAIRIKFTSEDSSFTGLLKAETFTVIYKNGNRDESITVTAGKGATYRDFGFSFDSVLGYPSLPSGIKFADTGTGTKTFRTIEATDATISTRGNFVPRESNAFDIGSSDFNWRRGYFQRLDASENMYIGGNKVAAPSVQKYSNSTTVSINASSASTSTDSGTPVSARIRVIQCGAIKFITVTCPESLSNKKWAHIDLSAYCSEIHGLSVVSITQSSSTSLSGSNQAGRFVVDYDQRVINEKRISIGCEAGGSNGGFTLFVIAT